MTSQEECRAIAELIERLAMRFPQLPAEIVDEVVRLAHGRYVSARIRNFVPLLVEHDVVGELRVRADEADRSHDQGGRMGAHHSGSWPDSCPTSN